MNRQTEPTVISPAATRRRNPVIRLLASIWFGVALLFLIFAYSSLMSAFPQVRGALEVTDMVAFRHWFFVTLVGLFMVSLTAATFFRTRWNGINAGALTCHLGLLLLCVGAVLYFGTKVEGSVRLRSPSITVRATSGDRSVTVAEFLAEKGVHKTLGADMPGMSFEFDVLETESNGVQPVAKARVAVRGPTGATMELTLTTAESDWQPIAPNLQLGLVTYPPERYFYDNERVALYVSETDAADGSVHEIEHLPFHRERYLDEGVVLKDRNGDPMPTKRTTPTLDLFGMQIPTGWFERWRMPIAVDSEGLPFSIEVTGYVPYILGLRNERTPDGMRRVPVLEALDRRLPGLSDARGASAVRLKLTGQGELAGWSDTQWCQFSGFPEDGQGVLHVHLPNGKTWEIIYARYRHDIGAELAGRKLSVTYFPGGWDVEAYRTDMRYLQDGASKPVDAAVYTNHTAKIGPWMLFQSGAATDYWSWTILGVGNQNGLQLMNIGWIVVTIGCLYAFYVKPVLLRRRKAGGRAK